MARHPKLPANLDSILAEARYLATLSDASGTAPPSGTIVRLAIEGKYTPAQGDSAEHAASLLGVAYDDPVAPLLPLNGVLPRVRFDSLPILHAPAYLSEPTEGKASCTRSTIGLLPVGIVVGGIAGSPGSYTATILAPYRPMSTYGTTKERLDAETNELLGVDLTDGLFDDFDNLTTVHGVGTPSTTHMVPDWLRVQNCLNWSEGIKYSEATGQLDAQLPSEFSVVDLMDMVYYGATCNTTEKWRLSARVKFPNSTGTNETVAEHWIGLTTDGRENGIAIGRFALHDATQLAVRKSVDSSHTFTDLGVTTYDNSHQLDLISLADGNVLVRVDGTQVASIALPTITAATWLRLYSQNDGTSVLIITLDWIYFRKERPT